MEAAINEFVSAVTAAVPGGRMAQHSVFSLLVEGYKRCSSESVVEDARGLVVNAVARSQDLGALVAEIRSEGVFDREISEKNERIADMPGIIDFDPGIVQALQAQEQAECARLLEAAGRVVRSILRRFQLRSPLQAKSQISS